MTAKLYMAQQKPLDGAFEVLGARQVLVSKSQAARDAAKALAKGAAAGPGKPVYVLDSGSQSTIRADSALSNSSFEAITPMLRISSASKSRSPNTTATSQDQTALQGSAFSQAGPSAASSSRQVRPSSAPPVKQQLLQQATPMTAFTQQGPRPATAASGSGFVVTNGSVGASAAALQLEAALGKEMSPLHRVASTRDGAAGSRGWPHTSSSSASSSLMNQPTARPASASGSGGSSRLAFRRSLSLGSQPRPSSAGGNGGSSSGSVTQSMAEMTNTVPGARHVRGRSEDGRGLWWENRTDDVLASMFRHLDMDAQRAGLTGLTPSSMVSTSFDLSRPSPRVSDAEPRVITKAKNAIMSAFSPAAAAAAELQGPAAAAASSPVGGSAAGGKRAWEKEAATGQATQDAASSAAAKSPAAELQGTSSTAAVAGKQGEGSVGGRGEVAISNHAGRALSLHRQTQLAAGPAPTLVPHPPATQAPAAANTAAASRPQPGRQEAVSEASSGATAAAASTSAAAASTARRPLLGSASTTAAAPTPHSSPAPVKLATQRTAAGATAATAAAAATATQAASGTGAVADAAVPASQAAEQPAAAASPAATTPTPPPLTVKTAAASTSVPAASSAAPLATAGSATDDSWCVRKRPAGASVKVPSSVDQPRSPTLSSPVKVNPFSPTQPAANKQAAPQSPTAQAAVAASAQAASPSSRGPSAPAAASSSSGEADARSPASSPACSSLSGRKGNLTLDMSKIRNPLADSGPAKAIHKVHTATASPAALAAMTQATRSPVRVTSSPKASPAAKSVTASPSKAAVLESTAAPSAAAAVLGLRAGEDAGPGGAMSPGLRLISTAASSAVSSPIKAVHGPSTLGIGSGLQIASLLGSGRLSLAQPECPKPALTQEELKRLKEQVPGAATLPHRSCEPAHTLLSDTSELMDCFGLDLTWVSCMVLQSPAPHVRSVSLD